MKKTMLILIGITLLQNFLFSQEYFGFFKNSFVLTDKTIEMERKDSLITTLYLDSLNSVVSNVTKDNQGNIVSYSFTAYGKEMPDFQGESGLKSVSWRGDTLEQYVFYNGEIGFRIWEKRLNGSIYEMEYDNNGNGKIKEYYPSGKLFKIGIINKTIITFKEYYETGALFREYSETNFIGGGVFISSYKQYSQTGQLLISGNYLNYSDWYKIYSSSDNYLDKGIRNGKWTYYTNKGRVYKEEIYNKGELEIVKEKKIWLKKNEPKHLIELE